MNGHKVAFRYPQKAACFNVTKGKGKVVPVLFLNEHHIMKAYWGSRGIAPLIL
jgi:hypothetical protein